MPGAANRIIKMAEQEANHRHEMERLHVSNDHKEGKRGQICGLIIGSPAITLGAAAAMTGAQLAGGIIGGLGVAGLVSAFILDRKKA